MSQDEKRSRRQAEERDFALLNPLSTFIAFLITESLSFFFYLSLCASYFLLFCRLSFFSLIRFSDLPSSHTRSDSQSTGPHCADRFALIFFIVSHCSKFPIFLAFLFTTERASRCCSFAAELPFLTSFVFAARKWRSKPEIGYYFMLLSSSTIRRIGGLRREISLTLKNFSAWQFFFFIPQLSFDAAEEKKKTAIRDEKE